MRKVFVLAGLLLATTWPLLACEICGCALTGQFPGVLPRFHSSALTTRYDVDHFLTDHYGRLQEETFQQYSLQARWEFSPRWQLTGVLPYRLNTQVAKTESLRINGLGDLQLNAWYTLWNNADSLNKNVKQTPNGFYCNNRIDACQPGQLSTRFFVRNRYIDYRVFRS